MSPRASSGSRPPSAPAPTNSIDGWRARAQEAFRRAHNWREHPTVVPLRDGERGSGWRRGEVGLADYPAGSYPSCSRHGAMISIGNSYWRCLVEGCNAGAEWQPEGR
jgi:hypothetical protein